MSWLRRLSSWLFPPFDDFQALADQNRAFGRAKSFSEARAAIERDPLLNEPAAAPMKAEILRLIEAPDPSARARAEALVEEAIAASRYLVRPGTVEELWILQGHLDRCLGHSRS